MSDSSTGKRPGRLEHPLLAAIVAALVSALIGAVATVWAAREGKLDAIASPPTTTVTTTAPGPATTTTVTVTPPGSTAGAGTTNTGTNTGTNTAGDSLAELQPIAGGFVKGSFAIHAQPFGDGLYRNVGTCNRTVSTTWNLARKYTRFNAVIGLTDKSTDPTLKVKFTAYITDGTSRTATKPVVLGKYQAHPLQVTLNHADALELEAVLVASEGSCSGAGAAAWGDPRLYAE
ncbi:NPCBM/NEW2 domain-containing protein [Kribbella steppae]|uniref:NPCBM/NEW2 domain-containing protein n=1 Tax=Kribbella steppae TaxID=2512223 RepID=A0A4R2HT01_9ACTN|nr:NPCBM/NEW2 domain-containing protein [Kribbella steppae]TCO34493.1 NPCBM/NEW2 domain-containing protein [Kribbella steppae]